jgi:hypothetical protein
MPHKKIYNHLSKEIYSICTKCHIVPSVREIKHSVHINVYRVFFRYLSVEAQTLGINSYLPSVFLHPSDRERNTQYKCWRNVAHGKMYGTWMQTVK